MEKDNTTVVLTRFVKELRIPVTRQSICEQLEKHPDYDSLLAFSDVLDQYRVPNGAYKLKFDQLTDVPLPFIAHIKNKEFAVISALDEKAVVVSNEKWNAKKISLAEFKKLYSGSVLVAEKDEASGEAGYAEKHQKEVMDDLRLTVVFTGGFTVFIAFLLLHSPYVAAFNLPVALLTLFKTVGLIISVLLLIQSIDANNPLIQKLCGGGEGKDCNAILSSKAAKVRFAFGTDLSWSEVGFFYFAGTWLVLLFNSGNVPVLQTLALLNVVSLPYTFYSVYYQWRVAKQWCVFCCAVQALLWLEFFAFTPYLFYGLQMPSAIEFSSLIMGMAIPVLTWMLVKPYLLQAKQIAPIKAQLRRFKYNKDLFNKALNDEVKYTLPAEEHSLILGNREAENIITIVSNPYCLPCNHMHKILDEWLTKKDNIKLQVIFLIENNANDPSTEVAAHLLNLYANKDHTLLKKAMGDWHENKYDDYKSWVKVHPVKHTLNVNDILEGHKQWCEMTEITGTPTLFINGRKLPDKYQPEDIKYFI
jgi:protein-disulfide isomerase/uncharacterized membrane protein